MVHEDGNVFFFPLLLFFSPFPIQAFVGPLGAAGGRRGGGRERPSLSILFSPLPLHGKEKRDASDVPEKGRKARTNISRKKVCGERGEGRRENGRGRGDPAGLRARGGYRGLPTFSTLKDYHLCNN